MTASARGGLFPNLDAIENHTGELRDLPTYGAYDGVPMEPGEWPVTTGDGVGVAAALAHHANGMRTRKTAASPWSITNVVRPMPLK